MGEKKLPGEITGIRKQEILDRQKRYKEEREKEMKQPDSDKSVREVAAAQLWHTGDPVNMEAAEKIWAEVGTHPEEIEELKKFFG